MKSATAALLAVLAACSAPPPRLDTQRPAPQATVAFADIESAEQYNGKQVTLAGTFGHINARHGTLTLDTGLVVTLPHFDQIRRGDAWLEHVGKRCTATGVLYTSPRDLEEYGGPILVVEAFEENP